LNIDSYWEKKKKKIKKAYEPRTFPISNWAKNSVWEVIFEYSKLWVSKKRKNWRRRERKLV